MGASKGARHETAFENISLPVIPGTNDNRVGPDLWCGPASSPDEPSVQRYTAKPSVLLSRQFASAVFHRTETTKPRLDQFAKCDILDYTTQKCLQKALISGRLINEPLVWCMRLKNKEITTFICSSFHSENQGKSEWESYHDHAIKFAQPKMKPFPTVHDNMCFLIHLIYLISSD